MQSLNPWQIEIDHKHMEASPQDHFVGGQCHHPPISPDIRPSENQSLWFGDKYLSSDYLVTTSLARVCTGALGRRVVLLRQHLAASARPSVAVRRASSEHLCVSSPHFPGGELLVTAKNCFVKVIQFSDQSSFRWRKWRVVY